MIHFTGSDRYCLDKNYAGVLIIWDRMFGTFEWYRPNESLSYGLVDQPQFFNPLRHQVPTKINIYRGFLGHFFVNSGAKKTQKNSLKLSTSEARSNFCPIFLGFYY